MRLKIKYVTVDVPIGVTIESNDRGHLVLHGPLDSWADFNAAMCGGDNTLRVMFEHGYVIPDEWVTTGYFSAIYRNTDWSISNNQQPCSS